MNGNGAVEAHAYRYSSAATEWRRYGLAAHDSHLSRISQYWTGKLLHVFLFFLKSKKPNWVNFRHI